MYVAKECSPGGGGGGGGGTFHSNAVFSIEGLIICVHLFCSDMLFLFSQRLYYFSLCRDNFSIPLDRTELWV